MITLHTLDFSEENPSEKEFAMRVASNSKPLTILILNFTVDEQKRVHISIVGRGNEKVFSTSG